MVKVGFIVEGDAEKQIVSSEAFRALCQNNDIEILRSVFPQHKKERGKDIFKNSEKLSSFISLLYDMGAKVVFCMRDLEDLPCITSAKEEINTTDDRVKKIIVVRQIETWFLGDTVIMQNYFGHNFIEIFPETIVPEPIEKPAEKLKEISLLTRNGKGIGDKLLFAKRLIRNGFTVENAAKTCPSAAYFLNKLQSPQIPKGA